MPFTAGQKLRASDLNTALSNPAYARVLSDTSKTSSTTFSDITGLTFSLAANSEYLMDGFLSYYCIDGVDLKVAFTGPTGMTTSWGVRGLATAATTEVGDTAFTSLEVYTDTNFLTVNTETNFALTCSPAGFWRTGATAGTLQMRFAQNVSDANALVIKRGSWLRLYKYS